MGPGRASEHGRVVIHGAAAVEDAWLEANSSLRWSPSERSRSNGLAYDSSDGTEEVDQGRVRGSGLGKSRDEATRASPSGPLTRSARDLSHPAPSGACVCLRS